MMSGSSRATVDLRPASKRRMKLYFSPGACSLHPHIVLRELGLPFDLVRADIRAHKLHDGSDFYAINRKGYLPTLERDDKSILTEGAVIDQYLAHKKPESYLLPAAGTMERPRAQEWVNFIAAEIHKSFTPLFGNDETVKEAARARVGKKLDFVSRTLEKQPYLMGETFTAPDAYLYNMLRWTTHTGI